MNTRFRKTVARATAAVGFLVGSALVGCSSSEETPAPGPSASGSMSSSGTAAGGSASGGTGAVGGGGAASGSGGAMAGAGGAGACLGNQILVNGACACPAYAPTFCEAGPKCVSEMKDPDNCGMCGKACGATSTCAAGACQPDLSTLAEVAGCGTLLLVGGPSKLYALSTMTGDLNVFTLPAGGAPTKLGTVAGGTAFAVDANNAYVAAGMTIHRIPLAGGASAPVVTETTAIRDLAVTGSALYYATGAGVKSIAPTANNGTPAPALVALSASQGEPQGVAAAGGVLLYSSALAFNVERCDTTMSCSAGAGTDVEERGPGHKKLGQSQGGLIFGHRSLQTDGTTVFWVNNGLQGAPIMPNAQGEYPSKGIAIPLSSSNITAFAVAGTTAYFTEQTSMDPPLVSFEKSAFEMAEPVWLARNLPLVTSIAVDAAGVYLASGCKILKSAL